MTHPNPTLVWIAVVALSAVFFKLAGLFSRGMVRYRKRAVLTENELDFFWKLRTALPECHVFPQTAMSGLIEPTAAAGSKEFMRAFGRIAQKRVDFAVFDNKLELLCVVELDDKTHNASKDRERDKLLGSALVKTHRFQSRKKPGPDVLRSIILGEKVAAI